MLGQEFEQGDVITISVDAEDSDGNIASVQFFINDVGIGTSQAFPYKFEWNTSDADLGNYVIKATATDNENAPVSDEVYIKIKDTEVSETDPIAEFTANKTNIYEGETVKFTDLSERTPTTWFWNFGDTETSQTQNPSHTYKDAGIYTVSLTVTNATGEDTEVKTNYIIVNEESSPPVAEFSANTTSVQIGEIVTFTDQSANEPTSWTWNFGDGKSSNDQNATHSYSEEGIYTVSLTVSNAHGNDTETKSNYIIVTSSFPPPVIDGEGNDEAWSNANIYMIDKDYKDENPSVNATWKALWTFQGIYVLVEAVDDIWSPSWTTDLADWQSDKIELYFDMSNPQEDGQGAADGNGNWQVAPNFSESQPGVSLDFSEKPGVKYATTYNSQGTYAIEYYVPFSSIPNNNNEQIDPNVTQTIGFDVTVIDNDNDTVRHRHVWSNIGNIDESWNNMDDVGLINFESDGTVTGEPKTK